MKEKYLFRGKNDGDWVYGDLIYSVNENQHYIIERTKESLSFSVDEDSVGEFTGRADKHGTKIFSGDLVFFCNQNHDEEDGAMTIQYKDGKYFLVGDDLLVDLYECYDYELEVVGNIIDNKGLENSI